MDFQSVIETFAEAWVAANTQTPLTEAAEQGFINGPPTLGQGTSLTVMHDISNERHETENLLDSFPNSQNSTDLQNSCPTLCELRSPFKSNSSPQGKSMPVHCIIEQILGPQACGQYVELDSYAIIPGDTLFSELVRTALVKLGYSVNQMLGAKGAIQIKNWKLLSFDQITENAEATVNDILGELTTVTTLYIRLYSAPENPHEWIDTTVRNAVLELLREMSQSKLSSLCPLSQSLLSNIINNKYMGKIGKEKCQEFGTWYLSYRKPHPEQATPEIVPSDRPLDGRLTFHPSKELPIMRDWFHGCQSPSRRTLQMYVDILNQGPVRQQERPKVALTTLKNWWKNEKQRERKKQRPDDLLETFSKVKSKRKCNLNINLQREESCDSHLNELDDPENGRTTLLKEGFNSLNQNSDVDQENVNLKVHHSNNHKVNNVQENDKNSHNNSNFQILHNMCINQNQEVFNNISGIHLPEQHKAYNNKIIKNTQSTQINEDISTQICSETDVALDIE